MKNATKAQPAHAPQNTATLALATAEREPLEIHLTPAQSAAFHQDKGLALYSPHGEYLGYISQRNLGIAQHYNALQDANTETHQTLNVIGQLLVNQDGYLEMPTHFAHQLGEIMCRAADRVGPHSLLDIEQAQDEQSNLDEYQL